MTGVGRRSSADQNRSKNNVVGRRTPVAKKGKREKRKEKIKDTGGIVVASEIGVPPYLRETGDTFSCMCDDTWGYALERLLLCTVVCMPNVIVATHIWVCSKKCKHTERASIPVCAFLQYDTGTVHSKSNQHQPY